MTITEFLLARIAEDEADALPFRNELGDTKQWRCDEIGGAVREVGTPALGLPDLLAKFDTHLEGAHVARWDPGRVLAECAAKRAILETVGGWQHDYNDEDMWYSCPLAVGVDEKEPGSGYSGEDYAVCQCGLEKRQLAILAPLASVYADHPDYQQEWAL
jgi:hypothetical protein